MQEMFRTNKDTGKGSNTTFSEQTLVGCKEKFGCNFFRTTLINTGKGSNTTFSEQTLIKYNKMFGYNFFRASSYEVQENVEIQLFPDRLL